jgi:hypothetical protein
MAEYNQLSDGRPDGTQLGQSATDKVALYGATPVVQRSAAAQATSLVSATAWASVHHNALIEIMNTLTAIGAWKGGA